jgi:hypothetical protein
MRWFVGFFILALVAALLIKQQPIPEINMFVGADIIFDPSYDPSDLVETSPNNNCSPWEFNHWQPACDNRVVRGI